jgi:hypothetical protein
MRTTRRLINLGIKLARGILLAAMLQRAGVCSADTLNVINFGATPDGTSDNTAAIQRALDAALPYDGVYLPAGVYLISATLRPHSNTTVIGDTDGQTVVQYNSGDAHAMIELNGVSNVEISDLTLEGANSPIPSYGIAGHDGSGLFLHRLIIQNFTNPSGCHAIQFSGDDGTFAHPVTDSVISDNAIANISANSPWGGGIRMSWGSSRNHILRNVIDNTGRGGIFGNDGCTDLVIQHNTVTRSGQTDQKLGIELANGCDRATIEDNSIDHWLSISESDNCAIRRNTVQDTEGEPAFIGIEVISQDTVVTDNIVDHGQYLGLSISGAHRNWHQYYAYNSVQYMNEWGVQLQGEGPDGARYLYFYKNKFINTVQDPRAPYPGSQGRGFRFNHGTYSTTLDSNEIRDNQAEGLQFSSGIDQISVINNVITGNAYAAVTEYRGADLEWFDNTVSGNGDDTEPASRGFPDQKPVASFSSPDAAAPGEAVEFTNASYDPDGTIAYSLWDFGDGLPSNAFNPTYTYLLPGNYRVTLLVWDDSGRAARAEKTIAISK